VIGSGQIRQEHSTVVKAGAGVVEKQVAAAASDPR